MWICNLGTIFLGLNSHNELFQTEEEMLAMHEEPLMPQFNTKFGDFLKEEVLLAWKPLFV